MILEIIAIVLIILFLIVAAVLLIPFHVAAFGSMTLYERKFNVKLSWLGITLWRNQPRKPEKREKKPKAKEPRERGQPSRLISSIVNALPAFEILLRAVRKAVRIRSFSADLAFGTGDPADTAVLAGFFWSLVYALGVSFPTATFSIRPDLQEVVLDGSVSTDARVRTVYLVAGFLRAYTKKPFRQFIHEVRMMR
jgi:hypothetical protein